MASATLRRPTTTAVRAISNIISGLPLTVTWRLGANPNTAEIEVPRKRFHEFRQYNAGKEVYIKVRKNFRTRYIFHGFITSRSFDFTQAGERVTVVLQGPRWKLGADFLKGKLFRNKDGDFRVLTGHKCIFNEKLEDSQISPQNGSVTRVSSSGVRPFSLDERNEAQSKAYSINDMLWYTYEIGRTGKAPLDNVVGDPLILNQFGIGDLGNLEIYDIDVDGMSILEGMDTIFAKAGLQWWCRPVSTSKSEIKAFIAGPAADTPRKYLYLADVNSGVLPQTWVNLASFGSSKNNIEAGRMGEDFANVATEVFAYGGRKIYQEEFTLLPGWNDATWQALKADDDITNIRKQLREKTSDNWDLYRDIGRKWILDETGEITEDAHDFTPLFGFEEWAQIARPFQGGRIDGIPFAAPTAKNPVSEVHEKIEMSVKILEDQAGIYLEGDELAAPVFTEQTSSVLGGIIAGAIPVDVLLATELKITAALTEDQALEKNNVETDSQSRRRWMVGIIPDSDGNNSSVNRRLGMVVDQEYQTDNINTDKETEVEDVLEALVERKLEENKNPRVSASFSIPWITTSYEPGDIIAGIRGRNLHFTAQVIEVRFELGEFQRTELLLEDLRLAES